MRGPGYSTFEIFDVARGQKGPLAALTLESSKNFNFNVFPETNVVLSTCYQK